MKIKFVQPTTLLDYPGKLACTIFLFGCNFRCGFCYNPELVVREDKLDLDSSEVLSFLEKRKGQLEGVCFTGGEALMTLEIEFLRKVKELGYLIKIDTNGSFPEKLKEIIDSNLVDYIAMDIKGTKEDYEKITGVNIDLKKIENSINLVSRLENYEFRTTIVSKFHNSEKILEELKWISSITGKKIKRFGLQGFKNKGKFIKNEFENEKDVLEKDLNEIKEIVLNSYLVEEVIVRV